MKNQRPAKDSNKGRIEDTEAIRESMSAHLTYSISKYTTLATTRDWYEIAARTARDRMVERWMSTMQT